METLGSRLRYAREKKLQLKQQELAKILEIPIESLGNYERDTMAPGGKILLTIYERTGVDTLWLLTGEGSLFTAQPSRDDSETVRIPLVEAVLSAGGGSFATGEEIKRYFVLRRDFLATKGSIASMVLMNVAGDSMDPEIKDKDIVLIDQSQKRFVALGIYAVALQGMIYLKRVTSLPDKLILESINRKYPPLIIEPCHAESARILGRAIWWCRDAV